jgi:hypothetical protein
MPKTKTKYKHRISQSIPVMLDAPLSRSQDPAGSPLPASTARSEGIFATLGGYLRAQLAARTSRGKLLVM